MKGGLNFEQTPPLQLPLRFFLSGSAFGILAGLLLAVSGDALASRWTPQMLALTHAFTAGFMLQVMCGALLQVLPVAIGGGVPRPILTGGLVHAAITLGAAALIGGFLSAEPTLYVLAGLLLAGGLVPMSMLGVIKLLRGGGARDVRQGLFLALAALFATVLIGAAMAWARGGWASLQALSLHDLHARWGLAGWGLLLLAGTAYQVVPMFQLTPAYPTWMRGWFAPALFAALLAGMIPGVPGWLANLLAAAGTAVFALATLHVQRQRKRARIDSTFRFWRAAMLIALAAALMVALAPWVELPQWEIAAGMLIMHGGFGAVMIGMLYKIVPFLVWLHLSNQGCRAPLMNQIIPEARMSRHFKIHLLSLGAALSCLWFGALAPLAGLLVAGSYLMLGINLLQALRCYRQSLGEAQPLRSRDREGAINPRNRQAA